MTIAETQNALQLIGPDRLQLNEHKEIHKPGPHQILLRVEAVGLCFSDLKLLKQFDSHARKGEIVSGIDAAVLSEIPSYIPGSKPTVPGHEVFGTIVAVGEKVRHHHVGQRVLVQTDYRRLKTAGSNAAFGYNFEGALQQYVLMDERVIVDPDRNESFLIPVEKDMSASAIALVEPWACVECSYITDERTAPRPGGRMLVVVQEGHSIEGLGECFVSGAPAEVTAVCEGEQLLNLASLEDRVKKAADPAAVPDEYFDDIVYFGADASVIEILNDKLAAGGIMNIVLGGRTIGRPVSIGVGRIHYGNTRWIGTTGSRADESYRTIPANGEIRDGEQAVVIGAAGPMGQMHVIRLICAGKTGVTLTGTDFDDHRLESLGRKTRGLAQERGVKLELVNPQKTPLDRRFSYFAIMAPVGALVAQAVRDSRPGARINIFAGIPATVKQELDLDAYIDRRCFMFGTSGSRLIDMKIVLEKVLSGQLDTNLSVDAVSGMAGAAEGIRAVENRTLAGKIIVYPQIKDLPLTPLADLDEKLPDVAAKLSDGIWTKAAEDELLKDAK